MKIYTYFQDIGHPKQNELVELWKISWTSKGYNPIVLNLNDAKKHPYFQTFESEMLEIFKKITGAEVGNSYCMSCFFRWLAYANQNEEKFYVSDYDAINFNFPIKEPGDKLHFFDSACPFFVSGSPQQFENLCKSFISVGKERIDSLKQKSNTFHDQDFFIKNFTSENNPNFKKYLKKYNILMTRDRRNFGGYYDPIEDKCLAGPSIGLIDKSPYKVFHISHENCEIMQFKYPELNKYSVPDLRIFLIKKLLSL